MVTNLSGPNWGSVPDFEAVEGFISDVDGPHISVSISSCSWRSGVDSSSSENAALPSLNKLLIFRSFDASAFLLVSSDFLLFRFCAPESSFDFPMMVGSVEEKPIKFAQDVSVFSNNGRSKMGKRCSES